MRPKPKPPEPKLLHCDCTNGKPIGVEYCYASENYYDGVSEWMCNQCQRRWGRWSGRELAGDEEELRFGGDFWSSKL